MPACNAMKCLGCGVIVGSEDGPNLGVEAVSRFAREHDASHPEGTGKHGEIDFHVLDDDDVWRWESESMTQVENAAGKKLSIRRGTIMVAVPTKAAPKDGCFICTGPKPHHDCDHDHIGEAVLIGIVEGVMAALTTRAHLPGGRAPLCMEHEMLLRELLAGVAQGHPEVFDKLGIEYKVA